MSSKTMEVMLTDDVKLTKVGTTYTLGYNYPKEDFKIQFNQKITRKFQVTILGPLLEFFEKNKEYADLFFDAYRSYLSNTIKDEQFMFEIEKVIMQGFDVMDKFLENHSLMNNLKIPKGLQKNKNNIIEVDTTKHLVRYSMKMKLFTFYKHINIKLPIDTDEKIMNYLVQTHLIEQGLDDVILNIVKGKVIATIHTRTDMWKYLEYSIRKSPDLYIAQLYDYTILYMLLFMNESYNPIGYLGDFINRQIIYVFSDVYVREVTYHDIEENHIMYRSLDKQLMINDISENFHIAVVDYFTENVTIRFEKEFRNTPVITEMLVYPIMDILLFEFESSHKEYYKFNLNLFHLYLSILFMSPLFGLTYIPKLITSTTNRVKKVNYKKKHKETNFINQIYDIDFPNMELLRKNNVINNLVSELSEFMYKNVITGAQFEFNLILFVEEYKRLLTILSDDVKLNEIKMQLENQNYVFSKKENKTPDYKTIELKE